MLFRKIGLLALAGLFAIGCDDDDPVTPNQAAVRVVHASPDAPAVDLLVDGAVVAQDVEYQDVFDYALVNAGTREIKVNAANTSTSVIDADVNLVTGTSYTILAIDELASIEPLVLTDNRTPAGATQVRVRVVHAAPSAPNVDIYVTSPTADINNATPVLQNVPFKANAYLNPVPEGLYRIRVTPTGTKTVAIDSGAGGLALAGGEVFTVLALDADGGGTPFQLQVLVDTP